MFCNTDELLKLGIAGYAVKHGTFKSDEEDIVRDGVEKIKNIRKEYDRFENDPELGKKWVPGYKTKQQRINEVAAKTILEAEKERLRFQLLVDDIAAREA